MVVVVVRRAASKGGKGAYDFFWGFGGRGTKIEVRSWLSRSFIPNLTYIRNR